MSGVQALPLVHAFSESEKPEQRAVFIRVFLDLVTERTRRRIYIPEDWLQALRTCLEHAGPQERQLYVADLGKLVSWPRAAPPDRLAFATRDDIDAILARAAPAEMIALAAEPQAWLRPEPLGVLVAHAQALAAAGDRRLVDALLSRNWLRLEAAPLFLEATSAQRSVILLAAQRAVLGRRSPTMRIDAQTASRLEYAAIAGDADEFAAELASALGVDLALSRRISADPTGEPLAVALIALGAARDVAVRVVTGRDMHHGGGYPRIQALSRLFDRVSPAAARRIMAALPPQVEIALSPRPLAAPRDAANPSPFLRRAAPARNVSPETTARSAQDSRKP